MARGLKPQTISSDSALGDAKIQRSLRFNKSDSTYLNRTPSSSSNRKTWTWSSWLKKQADVGNNRTIFTAGQTDGNDNIAVIGFRETDNLWVYEVTSDFTYQLKTTRLLRDCSAWFHIVVAFDTTQGTASDRVKLYVNGVQETSFATETYPSQNHDSYFSTTNLHNIGRYNGGSTQYFDGYMAEINFVDGQQLDPSYFGFTDPRTGIWMPKRYEGTYGTNGFYLDFSDNSSTASLGIDKSPNGNDFTANNFSVAAGVGNDSLEDTPTNNFCTLNSLNSIVRENSYPATLREGGLLMIGADVHAASTFHLPKSGKWYAEFSKYGNGAPQAISVTRANKLMTSYDGSLGLADHVQYVSNGEIGNRTRGSTSDATTWQDDADIIVAIAVDMDNGSVYFARANTWINSGDPTSGSAKTGAIATDLLTDNNGEHYIGVQGYNGSNSYGMYANFGQRPFTYTPPAGYKTLCTKNLPKTVPSVIRPKKHFDTLLYTGNDSSDRNIEGLEFQPDFVWIKNRDQSDGHQWVDVVRGANNTLFSNSNVGEEANNSNGHVNYFTSGGFNVDAGAGGDVNENNEDYVAWCWKAGGAAVTNNDGSITTQVSANQKAGFSIMTYTGTGSAGTCGHGLGAVPHMIISKRRDGSGNWTIYHKDLDHSSSTNHRVVRFNASAQTGSSVLYYGNDPTSTVQHQAAYTDLNGSSETYVAYCWTSISGYSKFGKYTGNGNSKGPYIHLGFRPAFIMLRRYDSGNNWHIADSKRQSSLNPVTAQIYPNLTSAEVAQDDLDILSNGFKIRNSANFGNASSGTYIYMAFAEEPGTTPFDTHPNAR